MEYLVFYAAVGPLQPAVGLRVVRPGACQKDVCVRTAGKLVFPAILRAENRSHFSARCLPAWLGLLDTLGTDML